MALELIKGRYFSAYGLLGGLGFVLGIVFLVITCKIKKVRFSDVIYVYVWAGIAAIVGAKILYLLLDIKNIIEAFRFGGEVLINYLKAVFGGGLVFYGGLVGGLLGAWGAAKYFGLDRRTMLSVAIPTLPLAHAFGRLGCHTVGCCYGVEVHGHFGKMYTDSMFAPNNVLLFPVQLTESMCDLVIFSALVFVLFRTPAGKLKESRVPEMYLIMYPVVRFILEFFRGDVVRGHFLFFSTSQWISLLLIVLAGISLLCGSKPDKKQA